MNPWALETLVCPDCRGALAERPKGDWALVCAGCGSQYASDGGIVRFARSSYAENFGVEWKAHPKTQFDRAGFPISEESFLRITQWDMSSLANELILDAGCGSGRYSEVALRHGARVLGIDLSDAVEAAATTLGGHPAFEAVQADLRNLPIRPASFDRLFCIGVLQHTPRPYDTLEALLPLVRPGGSLALWFYGWGTPLQWVLDHMQSKRVLRPVLRRIPPRQLYGFVSWYVPKLLPASRLARRLNPFGRLPFHEMLIPVANRDALGSATEAERIDMAVLDTYDWFSPRYDRPLSERRVRRMLEDGGFERIVKTMQGGFTCRKVQA